MQHWLNRRLVGLLLLGNLVWSLAATANEMPADVRIIVDISGSMKQTDPDNLRVPATNLLIELIPDDSQAGIWTFGRFVNMLTPLAEVDEAWRQQARDDAQSINSVGLRTNLVEALDKARWQLAADAGYQQSIILLTDGRIDMASGVNADQVNQGERQRLTNEVLPAYAAANARIHTLALSDAADKAMLRQIALETGGLYQEAVNADELLVAFLRAFDRAVPTEQVPLVDNEFTIDDSVTEFTALIFKRSSDKPVQLMSPSGEVFNAANSADNAQVRWHEELNYDLITVTAPAAGAWQADADIDPENRVQVLTDLRLQVNGLPETIFAGYPVNLDMALTNQGETVTEPALLRLTDVSIKVTAPDGRVGSKLLSDPESLPADGIYRETFSRLSQPGTYQLEVTASGPTFQRRQQLTATLMEPLRIRSSEDHQQQQASVSVEPLVASIDTGLSRIIARVISPDGSSVIQSMEFDAAQQSWQLPLSATKGPGRYEVELNVRGVTAGGATFKTRPDPLSFDFPLQDPNAPVTTEAELAPTAAEPEAAADAPPEPEASPEPEKTLEPAAQPQPAAEPAVDEPVEPAADSEPALTEQVSEPLTEPAAEEGGIAWWIYLLLALGNASVLGGAAWWWLRHRRQQDSEALTQTDVRESHLPPDLDAPELSEDELEGSFDSFDGLDEEEIQPQPEAPAGMGSDANIPPDSLDDEFSIDPDDDPAPDLEDDWGEFDVEDELGGGPDDTNKPD